MYYKLKLDVLRKMTCRRHRNGERKIATMKFDRLHRMKFTDSLGCTELPGLQISVLFRADEVSRRRFKKNIFHNIHFCGRRIRHSLDDAELFRLSDT